MDRQLKLEATELTGLFVVTSNSRGDSRGAFSRLFCQQELASVLMGKSICQINHSRTTLVGSVRGLHFQRPPFAEIKLIRCLHGRVWDLALDLRKSSSTFLQWHVEELSADNNRMLIVPEGFAHGFQVLEADSELLYLHTAPYAKEAEGGIGYNDPRLKIEWPLPITELSLRDANHPNLLDDFAGLDVTAMPNTFHGD